MNNSDYNKKRTNIFEHLPEVFQSSANKSVLENVFNRYLTKSEIKQVSGFVGKGNPTALIQRQIQEPTPHRQAFQLQPHLHVKIGTVEHLASYKNILNELSRLGVDIDRLPQWGNAEAFNWIPPIDFDKLVHYFDYYWYDTEDQGSKPQYLTIKNACTFSEGRVDQYQASLSQFGDEHTIRTITTDGTYTYFHIDTDVTELFVTDFIFYVKESANTEVNNSWFTVLSSEYDTGLTRTILKVNGTVTDLTAGGIISLNEKLTLLQADRDCSCYSNVGWDNAPWDDNQVGEIIWTLVDPAGPEESLLDTITNSTPPTIPAAGNDYNLWYDDVDDKLYQSDGTDWIIVQHNFSIILGLTQGLHFWDQSETCDSTIQNQWTEQNKWVHKNHIPNFSIAKVATMPIIEYDPRLELNEWTVSDFVWKYRQTSFDAWNETTAKPSRHEMVPIVGGTYTIAPTTFDTITFDASYGDLSQVFVPEYRFKILGSFNNDGEYQVAESTYKRNGSGDYETIITVVDPLLSDINDGVLNPSATSQGDAWREYHEHWLFVGRDETLPVNHQPTSPFLDLSEATTILDGSGDFKYKLSKQTQQFEILTNAGMTTFDLDSSLHELSLLATDDIRVYVDGIRQYGNYTEIDNGSGYVGGIEFPVHLTVPKYSLVRIEVGPATFGDIGLGDIHVRHIANAESEIDFVTNGTTPTSLIRYKKVEQVKSALNQYPLFDMYNVDGSPAYQVSSLFGFKEDSSYPINLVIGKRIVEIDGGREYEFEQFLVEDDNGKMYAYRDYSINVGMYWYDTDDQKVYVWDGTTWSDKIFVGDFFVAPIVGDAAPTNPDILLDGMLWYDTVSDSLKRYDGVDWIAVSHNSIQVDPSLRTIWRQGITDNNYIPSYVDKDRVEVPVGDELGDWEIPDQLYYNVSHENKKVVKLSEILTHFNSIIDAQESEPGFIGTPRGLFHLNPEINYSVGGTIKEHNDSYDTFLSSIFVNNITPISLIEFAQNQYESSLNSIKELYVKNALDLLRRVEPEYIANLSEISADQIIEAYEQNDANNLIYGDSTTYHDGVGIRNWITTLPFLHLSHKRKPELVNDVELNINEIIHHDGHRSQIEISLAVVESIIQRLIVTPDNRFGTGPTLGIQSINSFPTTAIQLKNEFGATKIQEGHYWYHVVGSERTLYRFNVTSAENIPPAVAVPDGSYWLDTSGGTGTEMLKVKDGFNWNPVTGTPGDIEAAWEVVDINKLLGEVILEVENRLYEAAPTVDELAFDYAQLLTEPNVLDEYLREEFNEYVHEREIDQPFSNLGLYNPSDPFTWNYVNSTITQYPSSINVGDESGGTWQDLYEKVYNTPYPHLEPWKLQGYTDKPEWWDGEYKDTTNTRRWLYDHATTTGMWENIRTGIIPAGYIAPDGLTVSTGTPLVGIPTYNYMSVNIDENATIVINGKTIEVDGLLPPYWDHVPTYGVIPQPVRTLISNINDVVNPGFDYVYGDSGLHEWRWKVSSQRVYDQLAVAFRMQPIRFMQQTFGEEFVTISGLQINKRTENVFSHFNTLFHGDVISSNERYIVNGINQWYVNNSRYSELDISLSDFRRVWSNWTAPLSYQFASIVDTSTLFVTNKNFDVVSKDYKVKLKKFPGFADYWVDSFSVRLVQAPPDIRGHNNESEWKLSLNTCSPIGRPIDYYGVQAYNFHADKTTEICTLYRYVIKTINIANNEFRVDGDRREFFQVGKTLQVDDSSFNDGTWEIQSVTYDANTKDTNIKVVEPLNSVVPDGTVTADYITFPWNTGEEINITSTIVVPTPLQKVDKYFLIRLNTNQFKLASSYENALAGIPIDIKSNGVGDLTVGKIKSTFRANSGNVTTKVWRHYELDLNNKKTLLPPTEILGIQNLINIVDGYVACAEELGFVFNYESLEQDPDTGRVVNWQSELENVISSLFGIRRTKFDEPNLYEFSVDDVTDEFTFVDHIPNWSTGLKVLIESLDGAGFPVPLIEHIPYYIIREGNTFKFAGSLYDAKRGKALDIQTTGTGTYALKVFTERELYPTYTINPFKNNLWFNNKQGVISNIKSGPYADIRTEQTIYGADGELISSDKIIILREDKLGQIKLLPQDDDTHICGAHVFVDGYEHVVLFNKYSTEGCLIYDPFVGLNTPKFDMEFFRQDGDKEDAFTLRPNVGGYVLHEGDLVQNIEGAVEDMRQYYDTYNVLESKEVTKESRSVLGYKGQRSYLDNLSINPKSQFVFWRGMIQSKGSVNSINAFINSRRFVDAQIDDFWAYRIADFGDAGKQEYPELNLFIDDAASSDLRLEFLPANGTPEVNFDPVYPVDPIRWYKEPEQGIDVVDNLYFDAEVTTVNDVNYNYGGDATPDNIVFYNTNTAYYITDVPCDGVDVVLFDTSVATDYNTFVLQEGVDHNGLTYERINSRMIKFSGVLSVLEDAAEIKIFTLNPAKSKMSPAKLIDTKANTTVHDVPMWDPARGHHFHLSTKVIDLYNDNDPAMYTDSKDSSIVSDRFWNAIEKDTVWFDTSLAGYVPYYDKKLFSTDERLIQWGKLADWGDVKLYQWTESDVPPASYDEIASTQEGDLSIPEETRVTGRAKSVVYKRERDHITATATSQTSGTQTISLTNLYGITNGDDGTGLLRESSQTWTAAPSQTVFNLINTYWVGQGLLTVTVDGNPLVSGVDYNETSNTSITLTSPLSGGEVVIILVESPLYSTSIEVDGQTYLINAVGENLQTFDSMLTQIRKDLPNATIELVDNDIIISSKTTGSTSTVLIDDNVVPGFGIFQNLINYDSHVNGITDTGIDGTLSGTHSFVTGDAVLLSSTETLPTPLETEVQYTVDVVDPSTIRLKDSEGNYIVFEDTGTGTHTVAKAVWDQPWVKQSLSHADFTSQLHVNGSGVFFPGDVGFTFSEGDSLNIYKNGKFLETIIADENPWITLTTGQYTDVDLLTIVRLAHEIIDEESSFDPDVEDDGTTHVHYSEEYDFTSIDKILPNNSVETTYYFWVELKTTHTEDRTLSLREAAQQMVNIPTPYIIHQQLNENSITPSTVSGVATKIIPDNYSQLVVRGLADLLNDDNRYVLRLTQDFTLRDDLNDGESPLDLKDTHTEWKLFREHQPYHIDRYLWDKITESIIQFKLDNSDPAVLFAYDSTAPVPAFDRVLYDATYGTDTRYGIGEGQAFVDGELALASIIADLEDPNNDFYPVDVTAFFEHNNFDSELGTIEAMDTIYNTFANTHVNRMFFSVLMDAFSKKAKYKDIMKSSMISLHGIRILETAGIFDD